MSHFTVVVIGDNVEEQLQPYHEFECTGISDQYIQDIDLTEEAREKYENKTERVVISPDGKTLSPYEDMFYREPTPEETKKIGVLTGTGCGHGLCWTSRDYGDGKGYRTKVHYIPEGYEEKEVRTKDKKTFSEFVKDWYGYKTINEKEEPDLEKEHKYGYIVIDDNDNIIKIIRRTNPNAKWDWYSIGGRWMGYFKLKDGVKPILGQPGVGGNKADFGHGDQARAKDIDFLGMKINAMKEAREKYEKLEKYFGGTIPKLDFSWKELLDMENLSIEEKREKYHSQSAMKRLEEIKNKNKKDKELIWIDLGNYQISKEEFIKKAGDGAITSFAVVKDGQWYEQGEMGWWACVSNEKEKKDWNEEFNKLLEGLSEDTLLTMVDCHI